MEAFHAGPVPLLLPVPGKSQDRLTLTKNHYAVAPVGWHQPSPTATAQEKGRPHVDGPSV